MTREYKTVLEATELWVGEMNAIPTELIRELMEAYPDEWEEVTANEDRFYDALPMWGTMWSFGDSIDDSWLEEDNNLQLMSECGFRIYRHCEHGYFFGIDGAGYDFFESHWIPLYKARGLMWHDDEI